MSTHFAWYPSSSQVTVPWNARYSFPSQANKSNKSTPRIPPKNGAYFSPGQTIRLEFPAQGYVNPQNTTIIMDVVLNVPTPTSILGIDAGTAGAAESGVARFQNNIQSIFQRVRLLYGSTVLEDLNNYNVIVRNLTEWTANSAHGTMDQSTINEGIGGIVFAYPNTTIVSPPMPATYQASVLRDNLICVNVRQRYIHGAQLTTTTAGIYYGAGYLGHSDTPPGHVATTGYTPITRRYQINLALGLFTQEKLIPTKYLASQLAIELTLEQSQFCIYSNASSLTGSVFVNKPATYGVGNVILLPEVLEFDVSYDAMFLKGLQEGGVPIKFSTWNTYTFSTSEQSNVNLNISERQRSVKAIYVVQRRAQPKIGADNGACFFDTSIDGLSTLRQYQYRIGARYFPGQPVECSSSVGGSKSNGGAEAWLELAKALNIVGDYRLSTPVNTSRWALQNAGGVLQENDFDTSVTHISNSTGVPTVLERSIAEDARSGTLGSQCFAMAVNLETSNGIEISGLNAEEQSDISFMATWKSPQKSGASAVATNLEAYTFVDTMLILRENNMIELIK